MDAVAQLETQYEQNQMMLQAMRRLFDPLLKNQLDVPGALTSATASHAALAQNKKRRESKQVTATGSKANIAHQTSAT